MYTFLMDRIGRDPDAAAGRPVYRGWRRRPPPAGVAPLTRGVAPEVPAASRPRFEELWRNLRSPYRGITTDGSRIEGLFPLADTGLSTRRAALAAQAYLDSLDAGRRRAGHLDIAAAEWRVWTNAFTPWPHHGLLLDDLDSPSRDAAMAMVAESLSARGFSDLRSAMRLNEVLGDLIDDYHDTLAEWVYWITVFGTPRAGEPWGWQLAGHHVAVHCFVLDSQIVLTPAFLGAEVAASDFPDVADARLFADEQSRALALIGSLTPGQQAAATLYPSMRSADLPDYLAGRTDGRQRVATGQDNAVLPYEGLTAAGMTPAQREAVMDLFDPYLRRLPDGHAALLRTTVARYLDQTWFSWIGTSRAAPFYYRLHSPVIIVEFDHHAGVFLANDEPEPFHVHTVVRTPNGNDYGKDLLRQHYDRHHRR